MGITMLWGIMAITVAGIAWVAGASPWGAVGVFFAAFYTQGILSYIAFYIRGMKKQ
jgi:hypothetical protein